MKGMIFWYKWGNQEFDVRMVRRVFKRKPGKAIDSNFDMHPCTRFSTIINDVIEMCGERDFRAVLVESDRIFCKEEEMVVLENRANGILDDLPF
jgi:hypothetical protein